MGKKSAHTGLSPKDRSINIMDKFMSRNAAQIKHLPVLPGRRKDPNIPIHMWPLKDQLDYWANRTEADEFKTAFKTYATWYEAVKDISTVYHSTFISLTHDKKEQMHALYERECNRGQRSQKELRPGACSAWS